MTDQPVPGPGSGPQPPPGPPTPPRAPVGMPAGPVGWYSGPVPFQGLVARENIGRAIGRTIAVTLAALVTLGFGMLALVMLMAVSIAAVSGGPSTTGDLPTTFVAGDEGNANLLLAIPVTGVIVGEQQGGWLSAALQDLTDGYRVKADLERAAARRDVKGIVLEMDTPGGTIFGARAIADAVAAYRSRTGKPVLAFVRGMSASGGMYAMAGADHIVADHGTLVGSIGVIFGPLSRYRNVVSVDGGVLGGGVETTGGISEEYITAGRSKDLGNPYRDLTDEERRVLQQSVDNSYAAFVDHVAAGRSLDAGVIRSQLGALIYDEQTAVRNGLVDEVGGRDVAYAKAAELAQLAPGNWQVGRLVDGAGGPFGLGALLGRLRGGERADANASGAPGTVDARQLLCARGATLLAYHGSLPGSCH